MLYPQLKLSYNFYPLCVRGRVYNNFASSQYTSELDVLFPKYSVYCLSRSHGRNMDLHQYKLNTSIQKVVQRFLILRQSHFKLVIKHLFIAQVQMNQLIILTTPSEWHVHIAYLAIIVQTELSKQ